MHNKKYDASIDYFAVLGVHYNACEKTVKLAYRKMARRYHPDVSKIHNATQKFQEISEAYDILVKYREAYCSDYNRLTRRAHQRKTSRDSSAQASASKASSKKTDKGEQNRHSYQSSESFTRGKQRPIAGKDRKITYPLTLRYAIRLLKIGYFYIPGLKVKMKFTREAFTGKTFRLKGKGYMGLFGGEAGDYLVSFSVKLEAFKWELRGSDLYGVVTLPKNLLVPGNTLELDSPSGAMSLTIPQDYSPDNYIKVNNMGLPADANHLAGHLYTKLLAA